MGCGPSSARPPDVLRAYIAGFSFTDIVEGVNSGELSRYDGTYFEDVCFLGYLSVEQNVPLELLLLVRPGQRPYNVSFLTELLFSNEGVLVSWLARPGVLERVRMFALEIVVPLIEVGFLLPFEEREYATSLGFPPIEIQDPEKKERFAKCGIPVV